jgi:diguanylate cyclase (GGDEF)-like protein
MPDTNAMRRFINLDVIVNTVSMLASNREGAIWISDCDEDAKFYEARCADKRAAVLVAPGDASDVLHLVAGRGIEGVVATVSDLNVILSEHEFRLSTGDVATLLVNSKSFSSVMNSLAGREWLEASERLTGGFRSRVESIASSLRSIQNLLEIEFVDRSAELSFTEQLISWPSFTIDWAIARSKLRSAGKDIRVEQTAKAPSKASPVRIDPGCGFGVLLVVTAAMRNFRPRGITPNASLGPDELLSFLRVGYDINEFESEEMFWRMRAWERTWGYPLLTEWRLRDPLGVLWDQRYWEKDLRAHLTTRSFSKMAAMKMDLDHFRDVNNTLGHAVGDEAIRRYCAIVRDTLRGVADVYRRGGDEVLALCPDLELDEAKLRAEELRAAIEEQFMNWEFADRLPQPLTASIGLVHWGLDESEQNVIRTLDQAQHDAKEQGRNRVVAVVLQS